MSVVVGALTSVDDGDVDTVWFEATGDEPFDAAVVFHGEVAEGAALDTRSSSFGEEVVVTASVASTASGVPPAAAAAGATVVAVDTGPSRSE